MKPPHEKTVLRFVDFKPPTDRRAAALSELSRLVAQMPTEDIEALVPVYVEHVEALTARGTVYDDGTADDAG